MPRRPYRVQLTLTALVDATSQTEANQIARRQLEATLKQLDKPPAPEPAAAKPPSYRPKKKVAPAPAHNQPREFVTWPHK